MSTTDAHYVDRAQHGSGRARRRAAAHRPGAPAAGDAPAQSGLVNWDALRDVDAVAVSHAHYDHLDPASLRRLGRSVPLIVPRGAARMVRGFERVEEIEEGEETRVGALAIRATMRSTRAIAISSAPRCGGRSHLRLVAPVLPRRHRPLPEHELASPSTSMLPSCPSPGGAQGAARPLDPARAVEALGLLRPRVAIPIHWGTYRMIGLSRPRGSARTGRVIRAPCAVRARGGRAAVGRGRHRAPEARGG